MNYPIYIIQLVFSTIGFLFFSFLAGIIGSYAIEYKKDITIIDRYSFAFQASSYPYIASAFLLWVIIVIVIMFLKLKKKRKNNKNLSQ
ncbi:hypothetical protein [Metabacillus fastidiosus]|uniref:hypothetical protein n=1 Tax=Metabacillus fastidiosus TaxID=1458 RepID=UPI002E220CE7|nr:hypothetical protein [Metabacillus fastidiosus]